MNRQVQTIFCDDIRQEVSGKTSYIGVYSDKMMVSQLPAFLPRLCVSVSAITPVNTPFRELAVHILKDDEVIANHKFDPSGIAVFTAAIEAIPQDERADRLQVVRSVFIFSPIQIDAPCTLQVQVDTEEEQLRGMSLRIEQGLLSATGMDLK
ncbi:MAG TPA: hypothetical protein ENI75_02030 [Mizugakiibacter sp.]|nr:hypothetical protein [Mizugakiibacter sp.]